MNDSELLKLLLEDKSPEEIESLRMKAQQVDLAGLLHTYLCMEDHTKDCDFYVEEVLHTTSKAREIWLRRTRLWLFAAGIKTSDDLALILQRLPQMLHRLNDLYPLLSFLRVLLPVLLLRVVAGQDVQPAHICACQSDPLDSAEPSEE